MSIFRLPPSRSAKSSTHLIDRDERQFAAIANAITSQRAVIARRLAAAQKAPADPGGQAVERDVQIRQLSARTQLLQRFGVDMTLGRMVLDGSNEPVYIGRLGLGDDDGNRLLVDWRSPAAAPFFSATHADPQGLASRRRYRWTAGHVTDYWDEAFTAEGLTHTETLDDQSAFIVSLGSSRSPRMRDVLSTIQADQDAIIRDTSHGVLVVDGGPGTGKTVVALHRAAYLLYADPRLREGRGGVLFLGPSDTYLGYVQDVLPNLGENGVQMATLRALVPEAEFAVAEADPVARRVKESLTLVHALDALVQRFEQAPRHTTTIETDWADLAITPGMWEAAFEVAQPGLAHNENRTEVWQGLLEVLVRRYAAAFDSPTVARRVVASDEELRAAFDRAWPELDGPALLAQLYADSALLAECAPGLSVSERAALYRSDPTAWTDADLPLLDAARMRVGSSTLAKIDRARIAHAASERAFRADVTESLLAGNSDPGLLSMLKADDADHYFADDSVLPEYDRSSLVGPFSHVFVDEAQELTDAQWCMVLARCPAQSITVVGDRAQARHGFTETWDERLTRVGMRSVREAGLSINYRTPAEVMAVAAPVIRAAIPDANVPTSIRESGFPVVYDAAVQRDAIVAEWLATHDEGTAVVIGDASFAGNDRVRSLSALESKGLEFDEVVLMRPDTWGDDITAAVDRYVAMTRSTNRLVILG